MNTNTESGRVEYALVPTGHTDGDWHYDFTRLAEGQKYLKLVVYAREGEPREMEQLRLKPGSETRLEIRVGPSDNWGHKEEGLPAALSEVAHTMRKLAALGIPDEMLFAAAAKLGGRREVTVTGRLKAPPHPDAGGDAGPHGEETSAAGFDPIGVRSGPVGVKDYREPAISLKRTSRDLTADWALWLLIKRNADLLSWDNYARQVDLLFFGTSPLPARPGAPGGPALYDEAARLSRRRFLPFSDTDAYRALKVATEAFVVTWGAVVPSARDSGTIARLLRTDAAAIHLANDRLGLNLEPAQVEEIAGQYFGKGASPTLPYLERVVQGLHGTDAGRTVDDMRESIARSGAAEPPAAHAATHPAEPLSSSRELVPRDEGPCGDGCLWLQHWNNDISAKLSAPPLIELIWSYWMEELQLVQTMNAISRRFQNLSGGPRDPLNQLELDPLRPVGNIIWGWVQDEQHRLPIERRAAEYLHEYGFRLFGRAVPRIQPADSRSKFLGAFHTLLNLCVPFFRQADDTTVVPDGFPLLNALREVHLILSEGAHNQFGDLPTTSRIEMMMQQWILARPEFREFLPRRSMIAYPEPWMHSVESMRKLQGWGDANTYQFWQLATTGEQIVSSIRWSDWNSVTDPSNAANWAAYFRPEIQTYIHSYRAVTGVDIGAEPVDVQVPGMHLLRRLQEHRSARVA
ncbi:hypothetical protein CBM2589_A20086 [Cupriavidus taiwanensis]|uniref:8-amino-7-oxononanoate synthase n=1 Tax=Cupriavidus taiwanensis TaxID=164546 RepID=A0A975X7M7_9BURK|nr:8-amino-7-oxononanoate synthase [Cupriavidus taiwanensis]SOY60152.1 hypothetical protein CBM2589_A20086 [Cupriavidus taiwanensis]